MPPKRSSSAATPSAPERPKRVVSNLNAEDIPPPARNPVTRVSATNKKPMTPTSTRKSNVSNAADNDYIDVEPSEEDEEDEDEEDEEDDGEAFSRGFYRGLMPAADAYYNKESHLIRLRCAELINRRSTAQAKRSYFAAKLEYPMALRSRESKLRDHGLTQFRKARAEEAATALLQVQSAFEQLKLNQVKYESDILQMRNQLENRKQAVVDLDLGVGEEEDMEELAEIRKKMMKPIVRARAF